MFVIGTVTSTAIMVSIGGLQKSPTSKKKNVFAPGGVLGLSAGATFLGLSSYYRRLGYVRWCGNEHGQENYANKCT